MTMPWDRPELDGWSIVGMNHFSLDGRRYLYVALRRGRHCIVAQDMDEQQVFDDLAEQAKEQDW